MESMSCVYVCLSDLEFSIRWDSDWKDFESMVIFSHWASITKYCVDWKSFKFMKNLMNSMLKVKWIYYCREYVEGAARFMLFVCFIFCKYISRLASWIASYILASLMICLIRFSIAGSEFSSRSSDTLLSSSSKGSCGGGGWATSFDLFLPQPVKALQKGRLAFVSIWLSLNCL